MAERKVKGTWKGRNPLFIIITHTRFINRSYLCFYFYWFFSLALWRVLSTHSISFHQQSILIDTRYIGANMHRIAEFPLNIMKLIRKVNSPTKTQQNNINNRMNHTVSGEWWELQIYTHHHPWHLMSNVPFLLDHLAAAVYLHHLYWR